MTIVTSTTASAHEFNRQLNVRRYNAHKLKDPVGFLDI